VRISDAGEERRGEERRGKSQLTLAKNCKEKAAHVAFWIEVAGPSTQIKECSSFSCSEDQGTPFLGLQLTAPELPCLPFKSIIGRFQDGG
jgi:hypothetical protein